MFKKIVYLIKLNSKMEKKPMYVPHDKVDEYVNNRPTEIKREFAKDLFMPELSKKITELNKDGGITAISNLIEGESYIELTSNKFRTSRLYFDDLDENNDILIRLKIANKPSSDDEKRIFNDSGLVFTINHPYGIDKINSINVEREGKKSHEHDNNKPYNFIIDEVIKKINEKIKEEKKQ
jgi:hypothetical protein